MVDYEYKNLFWEPYTDRQITIATEDSSVVLKNPDIHLESLQISESLCSEEQIRFGTCEASSVKFKISNVFTKLTGKWIIITEVIDGHVEEPLQIGRYKVVSDVPTADKEHRDVTAYDAMHDILHMDMTKWYNSILPEKDSTITLKQFRESFISYFDIEEELPESGLVNDEMIVERTIDPERISGKDVITAICEINGCFGHITRDGKFRYVVLEHEIQGLYPKNDLYPRDDLFPIDPKTENIGNGIYISCRYEDYLVESINKIQIRQEENDIGTIYPNTEPSEEDNCYIVENNFLIYGKSANVLADIAKRLLNAIARIMYRPAEITAVGNPCLEVGDAIRLNTKYDAIETYILSREMSGIQNLRDSYSAPGEEKYGEKINSINSSILQLKGKTTAITKTVDGIQIEVKDLGEELSTEISVTAGQIRAELANTREGLSNEIKITASGLQGEITDTRNGLQTQISANASGLAAEITRAKGEEGTLSTKLTATAGDLSAEVSRATAAEGTLSSRLSMKPDSIEMRVSNSSTYAGISISLKNEKGETVGTTATGTIEMTGLVKFTDLSTGGSTIINGSNIKTGTISADRIDVDRLKVRAANITGILTIGQLPSTVAETGDIPTEKQITTITENTIKTTNVIATNLHVKSANIDGTITADALNVTDLSSLNAKIGGFTIGKTSIYNGTNSLVSLVAGVYLGTDGFRNYYDAKHNTTISGGTITTNHITASGGYIGNGASGFSITENSLFNGTANISGTARGVYLGTDGFRNYYDANSYTTITGGKITTNNADIKGKITATSGYIGNSSGGFAITGNSLYNGKNSFSSTTNGVYVGTDGISIGKCKISASGSIEATGASITGSISATGGSIGGLTISSSSIYNGKSSVQSTANGVYVGTDGISIGPAKSFYNGVYNGSVQTITKPTFMVTTSGDVYLGANSIAIGSDVGIFGGHIAISNSILISSSEIRVGSYSSNNVKLVNTGIEASGSFSIKRAGSVFFEVGATSGYVSVGKSGAKLGFFGSTGTEKKSISNVSNTSNVSMVGSALNTLLTTLRSYGLIG